MKLYHQSNMVEVVKPAVDKLNYRCVTLDNGIRITLISDAEADKAAAAMDVSASLSHMCDLTASSAIGYSSWRDTPKWFRRLQLGHALLASAKLAKNGQSEAVL